MKILRALLLTLILLLVAVGLVVSFLPDLRERLFGYSLAHRLKPGEENDLALTLDMARGGEILGEGVKPSGQIPAERLQVAIRLYERVETPDTLRYEVREMRREKTGAGMPGVLGTEPFTLRVPPHGGVTGILRSDTAKNDLLSDANWEQFGLLIWPPLPQHRIKADARHWSGSYSFKTRILNDEFELNHRLQGKLLEIQRHNGQDYALIQFDGYIDPRPIGSELQVAGQGKVLGKALIEMRTGRNVLGAYNLTQDYLLELKGARYRWFENQDLKYYLGKSPQVGVSSSPSP